jgi:hypothetical protein
MLVAGATAGLVLLAFAVALGYGLKQAQREREHQRRLAYASDMKAAQVALQQNNRGLVLELLQRHVPKRGLAFTPDGKRFLLRGKEGLEIRETSGWTMLTNLPCADTSPFALSGNGRVQAWSAVLK